MYGVRLLPSGRRDLDNLSPSIFHRIKEALFALKQNPRPVGCIKLTAEEGYRIRVGDYRVLYHIDDKTRQVFIYRVKHRREVYH